MGAVDTTSGLQEAFQDFLERFPDHRTTEVLDELRAREFLT